MPAFLRRRNNYFWTSIRTDVQNETAAPGAAVVGHSAGATLTRTRRRSPGS